MNIMHQLTTIFCQIDDFCKQFQKIYADTLILLGKWFEWRADYTQSKINHEKALMIYKDI